MAQTILAPPGSSSGTYRFAPDIATLVQDAYSRIQWYPPQLTIEHMFSARVSLGLINQDLSGNRGINLFLVEQLPIPMVPGQIEFVLPANTIDLLDCYLRTFTPNQSNGVNVMLNVGATLTPLGPASNPFVTQPYGDVALLQPPPSALSCTAGNQIITMKWPAHGQLAGYPIFWNVPITIGGMAIYGFSIVYQVLDSNTLTFVAPIPALETQTYQGTTPLFFTTAAAATTVNCILPGHGLSVGDTWTTTIPVTMGADTVPAGSYSVTAVASSYQFTFAPPGFLASAAEMAFMNGGQLSVTTQGEVQFQDVPLFPLSRTDYINLAVKDVPGRPTSYWLDRIVPPKFSIYPVAPLPGSAVEPIPNVPTPQTQYYGMLAYRLREMQDANPVGGQVLDAPRRFWPAITAELCAMLAEKWRPEQWMAKTQAAMQAWDRASSADVEHVTTHLTPMLGSYFR